MLQYVYNQHEEVAHFVAQHVARGRGFSNCKCIGVLDETGKAIAGIVYNHYYPWPEETITMTVASTTPRWLTRETIRRMYEYPFVQLGVQMIVMHARADNVRVLRQLASGGYMLVRVPRLFGRDCDGVLCLFTREAWDECKFNPDRKKPEPGMVEFETWLNEEAA